MTSIAHYDPYAGTPDLAQAEADGKHCPPWCTRQHLLRTDVFRDYFHMSTVTTVHVPAWPANPPEGQNPAHYPEDVTVRISEAGPGECRYWPDRVQLLTDGNIDGCEGYLSLDADKAEELAFALLAAARQLRTSRTNR